MGTWNSRRRIISFVTHDEQKSLRCMRSYGCVRVSHPLRPCDRVGMRQPSRFSPTRSLLAPYEGLYARARLNGNLELSRRINSVRHSRRAEITTLHEVSWMRPRVPPTPPM